MKKTVILSVLGLSLAAASTTAYAQGGVSIGNYKGAFNVAVWDASVLDADHVVASNEGVNLTLWYGLGSLTQSIALPWDPSPPLYGYNGYYGPVTVSLPGWTAGQDWSFQVRASGQSIYGEARGSSVIWTENANIASIAGNPPGLPGISDQSIGLTVSIVPEPSTFALAGLGAAAMMIFRRRK